MTNSQDSEHQHTHDHHHRTFDPNHLQSMEARRRAFMNPEHVLPKFLTRANMTLLDVGCGAGFFTVPAAKWLIDGKVYALDRQQDMIDVTLRRAAEANLKNVQGITSSATAIPLPTNSVDAALMSMVFHDIPEQTELLSETARVLVPGGILYMVEWDRNGTEFGPPMHIRIRPSELRETLETNHFVVDDITHSDVEPAVYFVTARTPHTGD
ncbi:class I SAM-dependent methyltransferase [Alicyclobacillus curvatus]|nr:class I SAM-dependent methyltransferase [Alicyclobacillus curvatus]